ncbi:MAG TPA: hypothetical protein DCS97_15395 [Planctomycetes bacterium]|nr:hypothetical protein [Planctomycetota bacterium]
MHLLRAQIDERSNPRRNRHRHDGPELLWVEEGEGVQLTQHGEEPCRPGDVFVFPSRVQHLSFAGPGQRFSCLVLQTEPGDLADGRPGDGGADLLERISEQAGGANRLPLRPATRQQVGSLLRRALAEQQSRSPGARCAARCRAMEVLIAIARDPGRPAVPDGASGERHIDEARCYIATSYMTPLRLPELIALGPLGRSRFLELFKARCGRSVSDELLAVRIAAAQRMLDEGAESLLDVALSCGFGSQSHFNHRFRAATGCSPSVWLKR